MSVKDSTAELSTITYDKDKLEDKKEDYKVSITKVSCELI